MIYTAVRFSISFFCCFILKLCIENIKKSWDKTVLRIWSQIYGFLFLFSLNVRWKKSFFESSFKSALKKTFFQRTFKVKKVKIWDHILKTVLSQLFFMFSMQISRIKQKKVIENQTAVNFCLHHEFYNFLLIFGHFCCFGAYFLIFLQFFSGVQQYVWQCVIHTDVLTFFLQNSKHFYSKRNL